MTASSTGAKPFGVLAASVTGKQLPRRTRMLLERGDNPRSGQPVWRNSYTEGTIEQRIWKPIGNGTRRDGRRFTGALMAAARRVELESRAKRRETDPGCQNGKLGVIGLEVLQTMIDLVDFAKGTLEPAIATIAARIGRSYSAVHAALRRLQAAGFIDWIRRSRPREDAGSFGPQVEQISNAYALLIPGKLRGWWDRTFGKTPQPACDEDRRARDKADFDRMLASMTSREFDRDFRSRDPLLGPLLSDLARLVDERYERESERRGETGGVVPTP